MTLTLLLALQVAQTYQLSGDALIRARVPAGIISLSGRAKPSPWLSAEAVLWAGVGDDPAADALVASLRLRHPEGYGELRLGRMIVSAGALRPAHLDGAAGVVRAPWGTQLELFGGAPVGPQFVGRGGDRVLGGRISQRIVQHANIGLSFYDQRDAGELAHQELGLDIAIFPLSWLELSARGSYDLPTKGISEVLVNGGIRMGSLRADIYASHRAPSRILPATSIFSVLGDIPSRRAGAQITWRAAPRLDLVFSGGLREVDGLRELLLLRANLRLDEKGAGLLALELRRDGGPDTGWIGVRAVGRLPLPFALALATELEIVRPDKRERQDGSPHGALWPWGLVALRWRPLWKLQAMPELRRLEVAAAVEAGASPQYQWAVEGLVRLGYRWRHP